MPKPQALFSITLEKGRKASLQDLSTNSPASWLWDLGDGTSSEEQTPEHTYSTPGIYKISLTVENIDGEDNLFKYVYITDKPPINKSITDLIASRLPLEILSMASVVTLKPELINKYQDMFYKALPFELPEEGIFDDTAWPYLHKTLIAALVSLDIIQTLALSNLGSSNSGNAGNNNIKAVTTGPTTVEYHAINTFLSNVYQKRADGTSMWDEMRSEACLIASNLGIFLPFCKATESKGVRNLKNTSK
jgi:PKD repeat protein